MIGLNGRKADPSVVERMAYSLQHRGPDEKGSFVQGSVGFGFRRLAILDLSHAGHQPMVSPDGKRILVFNGEIYNYLELRRELQTLGHIFRSSGDTEVLLAAYSQWGAECLPKLNGMWAFLIYDLAEEKIFGARDRFGVKPLYRFQCNDAVFFASEIKAIRNTNYYQNEVNWAVASTFLTQGLLDVNAETFYSGIEQIPPGSAFEFTLDGRQRQWQYWSLDHLPVVPTDDPPSAFYNLFEDAVRIRMRSDVPVGICLSGGLDSTSILCAVARLRNGISPPPDRSLEAFSYLTAEFDEARYIDDTIQQTGAHLNKLLVDPQLLLKKLEQVLWYHDEPLHSMTAIIGFELMRLAAMTGVKVILNGQGADETIGGYHSYFSHYWQGLFRDFRFKEAWREIKANSVVHGNDPSRTVISTLRRLSQGMLRSFTSYQRLVQLKQRRQALKNAWFTGDFLGHLPTEECHSGYHLRDVLKISITEEPLPLYLRIEDRNSMAHSIEARLPFLDYRLVTLLFNLPAQWKMRGPWNKYVLRESMKDRIPESVRLRSDKMGFPYPSKKWFSTTLYEPMQDILSSQEFRERGIYNVEIIRKDLDRQRSNEIDASRAFFNIAQFEVWSKVIQSHVG